MSEEVDKHVLRKYEIVQKLGKGVSVLIFFCHFLIFKAYGIVWKAVDKKTRDVVALKKVGLCS